MAVGAIGRRLVLLATLALPLLDRLRRSPFGGDRLRGARLGLALSPPLLWTTDRVVEHHGEAVDAWITVESGDLERMLGGAAPVGKVGFRLGDREEVAPRVRQARVVLALAALGWCGPWPDPAADLEVHQLTRRAVLDLALGPHDGTAPLFDPAAPPELRAVRLRLTDGARPLCCTLGLSDAPGAPEFWTSGGPGLLRIAVLHWLEVGSVPSVLTTGHGEVHFVSAALPLPRGLTALVRVTLAPGEPAGG